MTGTLAMIVPVKVARMLLYGMGRDGEFIYGGAKHTVGGEATGEGFIVSNLPKNYLKNYKDKDEDE